MKNSKNEKYHGDQIDSSGKIKETVKDRVARLSRYLQTQDGVEVEAGNADQWHPIQQLDLACCHKR